MKIAVLPGDGIGPEIVEQAMAVLRALRTDGVHVEMETAPIGGAAHDASGDPLPASTLALAEAADAVLLGAVGGPKYDTLPRAERPEQGLLRIRKALGLFTNLRPAIVYPELAGASSLKPELVAGLDLMILRELTGDIYFGQPRGRRTLENGEPEGFDTMKYSAPEIRRIAHVGFAIARKRSRRLCSVDKANVLDTSILWRGFRRAVILTQRFRLDCSRESGGAAARRDYRTLPNDIFAELVMRSAATSRTSRWPPARPTARCCCSARSAR